jgi:hypothetical protein
MKLFSSILLTAFSVFFVILIMAIFSEARADCRSQKVAHQFAVMQGYPHGRKGWVIDHVCALAQGGIDAVSNMQYQTYADSKRKDKVENTPFGKKLFCNAKNSLPTRTVFNCK